MSQHAPFYLKTLLVKLHKIAIRSVRHVIHASKPQGPDARQPGQLLQPLRSDVAFQKV